MALEADPTSFRAPKEQQCDLTRSGLWSCEAGGSQVGANPIPIPHPTNLALFGHKMTLYRFNQGQGGI